MPLFENPIVQRMYEKGLERIQRLQEQTYIEENGEVKLPAPCYGCERMIENKDHIEMITGDQLIMCKMCFEGIVDGLVVVST